MMRKSDLVFLIAGVFATAAAFAGDKIAPGACNSMIQGMIASMWLVIAGCWAFDRKR